jgi:hypothetical protein
MPIKTPKATSKTAANEKFPMFLNFLLLFFYVKIWHKKRGFAAPKKIK